jgi:S1-C subfamily serine protease
MHRVLRLGWLAIFLLGSSAPSTARANPELYERTLRGTAWVISAQGREVAMGSAVLVDAKRRLLLTNYHVVEERTEALVFFPAYDGDGLVTSPAY